MSAFMDFIAAVVGVLLVAVIVMIQKQLDLHKVMVDMNQQWWDSKQRCCVCGHWGTIHDLKRHAEVWEGMQQWIRKEGRR